MSHDSARPAPRHIVRTAPAAAPLRILALAVAFVLLNLPAVASAPAASPVSEGVVAAAADFPAGAERFIVPRGTQERLAAAGLGAVVLIDELPVAPGLRLPVELERYQVYADGARISAIGPAGKRELPRTRRHHFLGGSPADPEVRVGLSFDPETGTMRGLVAGPFGLFEIAEPDGPDAAHHRLRSLAAASTSHQRPPYQCGSDLLPIPQAVYEQMELLEHTDAMQMPLAPSLRPSYQATIAVDTDNELNHLKFENDTTEAVTWLADLFTEMNVIYERDLSLRLLQGDTTLRLDTDEPPTYDDDPYSTGCCMMAQTPCLVDGDCTLGGDWCDFWDASGCQLDEFGDYWQANMGDVDRVLALLLSGKGDPLEEGSSSGIAWLNAYCEKQSAGGSYSVVHAAVADWYLVSWQAELTAHELGHNLGSPHTHCYVPPVDECFNLELSCYDEDVSCPSHPGMDPGRGTMMSYCHFPTGVSVDPPCCAGCGDNLPRFHPTVIGLLDPLVTAHHPGCIEAFTIFADGFESGDTDRWFSSPP